MKKFQWSSCYTNILSISFLLYSFQIQSTYRNDIYVSKEELSEVLDNSDTDYDYLGAEFSSLYEVIAQISQLEDSENSVLTELKNHIENGFSIGLHKAVLDALEYAEQVLEDNSDKLNQTDVLELAEDLETVINQVVNKALAIDTKKMIFNHGENVEDMVLRANPSLVAPGACPCPSGCSSPKIKVREPLEVYCRSRFRRSVEVGGKLKVYGKSTFKSHVDFDRHVKFRDDAVFKDNVYIKGDLTVDGTVTFNGPITGVTIIDVVIENLSATDIFVENLSAVDATIQNLSVTDLTVLSCMDSLCVNTLSVSDLVFTSCLDTLCVDDLSVVDASVSGTLSVADAIIANATITNGTITNFSSTDAVIQNASITDLTVLSCMDSLCVNNLSVGDIVILSCIDSLCVIDLSAVDATISGVLSAADAIIADATITNGTITNLSSTDAIITNATITNLSATDAFIQNLSVGDIIILSCLDSLCVVDLSAVDASISGTLSAADAIIGDATITNGTIANLSSTDAIITNATITTLSVTDLTVASCIDSLCVLNLSTTDISAGSLSLCDLTVTCDIFMNNSTSAAVGNIFKGINSFIHNFGINNTFVGINAGNFTTAGSENVGVGLNALFSNTTGFNDTAIGAFAMNTNTIGSDNSAYGAYSLVNNTQGDQNTAIGNYALVSNTTGLGNTSLGYQAGYSLDGGNNNTFLGNNAGLGLATGGTNLMIGYNSGLSLTTGNDNIYIANPGVSTETGVIRIGTPATQIAAFVQGVFGTAVTGTGIEVFVDANGQLGTVVSSEQFKHDIADMAEKSEDIYKLRPVTFVYNADATEAPQYGLIAEEVEQAFPDLVVYDESGKPFTVRYHFLPQLLLNEVQKLHATVQDQASAIQELRNDNAQLHEAMNAVMTRLHQIARK
jgi:hypothetical protein